MNNGTSQVDKLFNKLKVVFGCANKLPSEQKIQRIITTDTISQQDWVSRELAIGAEFARYGLPKFDRNLVQKASQLVDVGIHHHFVPPGLRRRQLLTAAGKIGIKLCGGDAAEADCNGEEIPTKTGVFVLRYSELMLPTDRDHRPFMCDFDQQWAWAIDMGGNGFSTAEKTIYMAVLRPWVELGRLPYMGGNIRCQNPHSSGRSLNVCFTADLGLGVLGWYRFEKRCFLWALPEVFQEL